MSNITKIRDLMLQKGINALLLTDETDRQYATGFRSSYGFVLILPQSAFFITDSRYIEAAQQAVKDASVMQPAPGDNGTKTLREILEQNGIKTLGVQDESMSYSGYLKLEEQLGAAFTPAQEITLLLRRVKQQYEVDSIVSAQRIAEKAFDFILGFIKEGLTEREIAAELEYRMAKNGAEGLAFDTICVSGENSSRPHGVPTDRKLQLGDFITMDFGCKVNGYCSDMTRTVALGNTSEEKRHVYDTVLKAQLAAIDAAKPGVLGCDMDKAARSVIEDAGFGKYFGHGTGHSVGLFVHESPNASPSEKSALPPGTVITCEPGIYLPGKFGVRIEDMLHITQTGCENLTSAPKDMIIL